MRILTIILFFIQILVYGQDYNIKYVSAKSGLTLRDNPSLTASKVGKLKYNQRVVVILNTRKKLSINDDGKTIKGQWVKVLSIDSEPIIKAYVFDGFLVSKKIELPIEVSSFDKPDEVTKQFTGPGCTCFYSLDENHLKTKNYFYVDNDGEEAFMNINESFVKFNRKDKTGRYLKNSDYEVFINVKYYQEENTHKGEMTIKSKDGDVLKLDKIFGECGCKC